MFKETVHVKKLDEVFSCFPSFISFVLMFFYIISYRIGPPHPSKNRVPNTDCFCCDYLYSSFITSPGDAHALPHEILWSHNTSCDRKWSLVPRIPDYRCWENHSRHCGPGDVTRGPGVRAVEKSTGLMTVYLPPKHMREHLDDHTHVWDGRTCTKSDSTVNERIWWFLWLSESLTFVAHLDNNRRSGSSSNTDKVEY